MAFILQTFFKAHIYGIFVTPPWYDDNAQQKKNRLLDAFKAISKYVAGHPIESLAFWMIMQDGIVY